MAENFSFSAARKEAEQSGLLTDSTRLKLKEGDNRIRLMSPCLPHEGEYQGKKNFKWLCYVIDRIDGKVKVFFMPHTIYKRIEALQMNPDYQFDSLPMPYDLTIHAAGAGTKEVEYSLMPARKETPVTAVEYQDLADQKPLKELQAVLKEKQGKPAAHVRDEDVQTRGSDSGEPVTADDIPF